MHKYNQLVWPLGVFTVLLTVYLFTLAPSISWWDCPEFITASWCWGIPHPPGNPLYITLGRVFCMWFNSPEMIARGVNFISGLTTAAAAVFIYLSLGSWIKPDNFKQNLSLSLAVICGFITFSMWDSAVEAEVYGVVSLLIAIQLWAAVKILNYQYRYLFLLSYLTALSVAVHPLPLLTTIPIVIAIVIHLFIHPPRFNLIKFLKIALIIIALAGLGISAVFIMYFRAQHNPPLNESAINSLDDLTRVLTRQQYQNYSPFTRQTSQLTGYPYWKGSLWQVGSYFNYWSWQHLPMIRKGTGGVMGSVVASFLSIVILLLSIYSFWKYRKFKPNLQLILIVLTLITFSFLLLWIMNFKFCPSDSNPFHIPQEPRSRDYFFSFSFALITIIAMISFVKSKKIFIQFIPGIFLLLLFYNGITGHPNRRCNYAPSSFAYNVFTSTTGKSILFVHGDNDTFPLWFAQIVQLQDPQTVVVNTSLLNASWYVHHIGEKLPFKLSKVYGDIYKDQWDPQYSDYETFCRNNLTSIITKSGQHILPGEIIQKCIILEAMNIDYNLNVVILDNDEFSKLVSSGSTYYNIYTTQKISYLESCWVGQGVLYQLNQGSQKVDILFENYIWRGIFRDCNLNEQGQIIYFDNLELNRSYLRDIDSRSMSIFYIRSLETIVPAHPQYLLLLEQLKSVMF